MSKRKLSRDVNLEVKLENDPQLGGGVIDNINGGVIDSVNGGLNGNSTYSGSKRSSGLDLSLNNDSRVSGTFSGFNRPNESSTAFLTSNSESTAILSSNSGSTAFLGSNSGSNTFLSSNTGSNAFSGSPGSNLLPYSHANSKNSIPPLSNSDFTSSRPLNLSHNHNSNSTLLNSNSSLSGPLNSSNYPSLPGSSSTHSSSSIINAAEALTQLYTSPSPDSTTHPLVSTVNKLVEHPIISNAVRYYELTKKSFGPFNYAAEFVEKSAIPIKNRIEINLNQRYKQRLDDSQFSKKRRINHDETKKRIQFCLDILRLANENINSHISDLSSIVGEHQEKIEKEKVEKSEKGEKDGEEDEDTNVKPYDSSTYSTLDPKSQPSTPSKKLVESKTEIVSTVKKIIHLISNFKPSSLSIDQDNLKLSIRQIILNLPSQLNGEDNDKVFIFAKESLDMIGKLTNVFNDQLNNVEHWIGLEQQESSNLDDDDSLTAVNSNSSQKSYSRSDKVDRISIDMLTD